MQKSRIYAPQPSLTHLNQTSLQKRANAHEHSFSSVVAMTSTACNIEDPKSKKQTARIRLGGNRRDISKNNDSESSVKHLKITTNNSHTIYTFNKFILDLLWFFALWLFLKLNLISPF
jgi:hypothetical protein